MSVELLFADLIVVFWFDANFHYVLMLLRHMLLIFLELLRLLFQFFPLSVIHLLTINDKVLVVTHFEEANKAASLSSLFGDARV